jgi:Icc-related predicted phosphoesterase
MDFIHWFNGLNYKYKVFIAGNHDFYFERRTVAEIKSLLPENCFYLCDSEVEIEGVKFWGSPITPWFLNWAFNRFRGKNIRQHWALIPADTDVLITHGPPAGILDATVHGNSTGCADLLQKIVEVKPKFHLFGHIHEAYGAKKHGDTMFVNASLLNEDYKLVNQAVLLEI